MAEVIRAETEVEASARDVYDQWARLTDMPLYMSAVQSVEPVDSEHTHWTVRIGGVEREFDAFLTEAVPNRRIAWASEGEALHSGAVTFAPIDAERTRVSLELVWTPESFVEQAGAMLNLDQRAADADLRRFKDLMEGRDTNMRGTDPDLGI